MHQRGETKRLTDGRSQKAHFPTAVQPEKENRDMDKYRHIVLMATLSTVVVELSGVMMPHFSPPHSPHSRPYFG